MAVAAETTLTLARTGWVFAGADSVEITFLSPIESSTEPGDPLETQYWLDTRTGTWNRFTAGAFSPAAAIPVAIVIADATGLVGWRCLDFTFAPENTNDCRPSDSVSLVRFEDRGKRLAAVPSLVSVYGRTLSLGPTVWEAPPVPEGGASNLVTGLAPSSYHYFYLTETGLPRISDKRPRHRPDLGGLYHPFESWRCVARTITDTPNLSLIHI